MDGRGEVIDVATKDPEPKMMVNRRGAMRLGAAAVGTAAGVGAYGKLGGVQQAQAIPPVAIGAAAVGASAAVGWALREYEVLGSDDPPEGLTLESLESSVYDSANARHSNNQSTFVDNKNVLNNAEHIAYGDGKIAAIQALNEEKSESDVQDAAQVENADYWSTVIKNFLESWNESVYEARNFIDAFIEHEDHSGDIDASENDDLELNIAYNSDGAGDIRPVSEYEDQSTEYELPDGSTFEVEYMHVVRDNGASQQWSPVGGEDAEEGTDFHVGFEGGPIVEYLHYSNWSELLEIMEDGYDSVNDGLITWVEGVYDDVQAGELDTEDLLTPRELAEMTADEEDFNQAISDLMALNVSVNLEREAEVHIPDLDATVYGQIATTGDTTLTTGTIDPSEDDASYYLTYDVSEGSGEWDAYETGIDGGIVTFTSEPWPETVYYIDTVAGETAEVQASDFNEEEEDETWTYDVSDQLDDSIVDIEEVNYYATTEETQYETVQLTDPFEIVTFRDSDGEEHDEAEYTRTETHDDENYITEEEWKEQMERHEELIEKYEDAQSGGFSPFGDQGVVEWARDNPAKAGGGAGIGYLILRALSI